MARIVCVGEAMLELSRTGDGWKLAHAGDTLNTAVHLARAGHDVAYLSAVGADAFSRELVERIAGEGVDTTLLLTHPMRQVGLYAISLDDQGERSFTYWRDTSAARALFDLPAVDEALAVTGRAELMCFSLISLAILPPEGRERLLTLCRQIRQRGGRVAFDGNYRPRLWGSADEAMSARDAAIATADFGFPTIDDERTLSGEHTAEAVAAHWQGLGCTETIVKLGAEGCRLPSGKIVPTPEVLQPVDTSGAGDAFNAGYLSARLGGAQAAEAALAGHATAAWTIMRPGAIPPAET